jgi:hypothetical protein
MTTNIKFLTNSECDGLSARNEKLTALRRDLSGMYRSWMVWKYKFEDSVKQGKAGQVRLESRKDAPQRQNRNLKDSPCRTEPVKRIETTQIRSID